MMSTNISIAATLMITTMTIMMNDEDDLKIVGW